MNQGFCHHELNLSKLCSFAIITDSKDKKYIYIVLHSNQKSLHKSYSIQPERKALTAA